MKFTTILSTLAAVVPTVMAADAYIPYARWSPRSGSTDKTLMPIVANDGSFYFGNKQTTAVAPAWAEDPSIYNTTIISGPTTGGRMWMGVLQAGGQAFLLQYGAPKYNKASPNGTEGGIWRPFPDTQDLSFMVEGTDDGELKLVNLLSYGWRGDGYVNNDWTACNEGDVFTIGAGDSSPRCTNFEMILKRTDAPAPQRYHYYDEA